MFRADATMPSTQDHADIHALLCRFMQAFDDGDRASARCNYLILRFAAPDRFFHSCGHYRFELLRRDGSWKLSSITQKLLQSVGDPAIHGGARSS